MYTIQPTDPAVIEDERIAREADRQAFQDSWSDFCRQEDAALAAMTITGRKLHMLLKTIEIEKRRARLNKPYLAMLNTQADGLRIAVDREQSA